MAARVPVDRGLAGRAQAGFDSGLRATWLRTAGMVAARWLRLDPEDLAPGLRQLVPRAAVIVAAGQRQAIRLANRYVDGLVAALVDQQIAHAAAPIGRTVDGRPLAEAISATGGSDFSRRAVIRRG